MIKKTKWLIKEAKLRLNYVTSRDCIFCKIVRGEIATDFLSQTPAVVAFADVNPVASVHILIVPKKHIESVAEISEGDSESLIEMFNIATDLAKRQKLDAYRLTFNAGRFQHVGHLHMHLLAGGKIEWEKL